MALTDVELREMLSKKAKLFKDAKALLEKAQEEKRNLTQEEKTNWEKMHSDANDIDDMYKMELRQKKADESLAKKLDEPLQPETPEGDEDKKPTRARSEYRRMFHDYLERGRAAMPFEEMRALQADLDEAGGFTVADEQFVNDLIQAVDDILFIRALADVHPVPQAQSLGAPSLDADPADADWTGEITAASADTTMDFGKRELHPRPLSKLLKVSSKLLRSSMLPIEQIVRDRLAYKIAVPEEKGFLTGTGAGQPLGVFTAHANGISTGRDVSTGNTTTAIKFDGLIEAKYTLKAQYWAMAQWVFHRDAIKNISKLKDGEGQYIWNPSTVVGQPDRLLGFPFNVSEHAPNTFTTGLYVGLLGDFSKYMIADAMNVQVQRLDELYAETNQVGFIVRAEVDGMPVLEEAFSRVTLA